MLEQHLKAPDVVRRAKSAGKKLSASNIAKIRADQGDRVMVQTADALAAGLRVPLLDVVLAALNREHEQELPDILQRLNRSYPLLNAEQKPAVDYLLSVVTRELERLLQEVEVE